MSHKVTRANEAYTYVAPAHYDVRTTRLHDPEDVEGGQLIMGLSHFLPGGGLEANTNAMEFIYYVVKGEMTVKVDGKEYVLKAGDSIHCGPNTMKEAKNTGIVTAEMLVVLLPPKK